MGGRGTAGGIGGAAANQKMPELTGSAKQIKWAQDIRTSLLGAADLLVKNAQRNKALGILPDFNSPSVTAAGVVRSDVIKTFKNVTDASVIINKLRGQNYDALFRLATAYDRSKGING